MVADRLVQLDGQTGLHFVLTEIFKYESDSGRRTIKSGNLITGLFFAVASRLLNTTIQVSARFSRIQIEPAIPNRFYNLQRLQ